MWSIGELAQHAGVTVKTVRFYTDRGLLPETARSAGGHRRYGPGALDRLRLIRSLRTLDLPVPEVGRVLEQEAALEDVIAGQLAEIGSRLAALRWREAALHLLRDCTAEERAERLRLVGAVSAPPSTAALARFWRGVLPPRLPARLVSTILDGAVPQLPSDPAPSQVLTFARMHAIATGPRPVTDFCRPVPRQPDRNCRPAVLYEGLGEAYDLVVADVRAGRRPGAGDALDAYVCAYAASRGMHDTPEFRRQLSHLLARIADPLIARYWNLAAELSDPADPTFGAADDWLRSALDAEVAEAA
ncbi:MerR family transcriptional regulator [Streptomyces sp. NPDC059828]|uniref:MerR family transcriptional regulator n=1 Tax=Streptomyces sp. NPDC059828 TaxID=3346965 RepID=UPI00365B56B1